jgi:hypothetical protein
MGKREFIYIYIYNRASSWVKQIELYIIYVQFIYFTNLIFNTNLTLLIHELNSTSQLANRISNYSRVDSDIFSPSNT